MGSQPILSKRLDGDFNEEADYESDDNEVQKSAKDNLTMLKRAINGYLKDGKDKVYNLQNHPFVHENWKPKKAHMADQFTTGSESTKLSNIDNNSQIGSQNKNFSLQSQISEP